MHGQESHLTLQRMAVKVGLLLCTLHADDDISQHLAAVVLVHIVFAIHPQRETQHISGHGLVAVLVVQLCNGSVIHKGNADLCRCFKVFIFQYSIAGTADKDTQTRRNLDGLL